MALRIVWHSIALVLRNLGTALRVSVGPLLILAALALGSTVVALGPAFRAWAAAGFPSMRIEGASPLAALAVLLLMVAMAFIPAWIAVSWHRFILLEEPPRALPALRGRPVWAYVGCFVLMVVLMVLAAIPAMIVLAIVGGTRSPALMVAASLVASVYLTWIWLRLGPVLPSMAVGRALGLRDAWSATGEAAGALWGVAALLVALSFALSFLPERLSLGGFEGLVQLAMNWLTLMFGISLLTTLYGHFVERRPLA